MHKARIKNPIKCICREFKMAESPSVLSNIKQTVQVMISSCIAAGMIAIIDYAVSTILSKFI